MFKTGLVSVTFRQFACERIIGYVKKTNLSGIEWGSDIHIPFDNPQRAADVCELMKNSGLETFSYGSYYKSLRSTNEDFDKILSNAVLLGTDNIRIWGGAVGSKSLSEEDRTNIIADTIEKANTAKAKNIALSFEYHQNTITDDIDSALDLMTKIRSAGADNVYLYWQPNQNKAFEENCEVLKKVCPYLSNVHVFSWEGADRFPFARHTDRWTQYFKIIKDNSGKNHNLLMEFVKGDSEQQFYEDAETLSNILEKI